MIARQLIILNRSLWNGVRHRSSYTKIRDINKHNVDDEIQIKGWINNFRKQSKFFFIDLKDGSTNGHLQVMVDSEVRKQNPDMGYGATIIAKGTLGKTPRGAVELRANQVKVVGKCPVDDGEYPFKRKQIHAPEYIREYLHLRPHVDQFQAIFRARHLATSAFHRYFDQNGFVYIHTPILTSNSCEGAGELFSVVPLSSELLKSMKSSKVQKTDEIYFNRQAFLTVSGQMHLEAMCSRFGAVYNFGPVFRAENSNSTIHMCEFYMIEAEESFVEGISDITNRIESTIKGVTKDLLDNHSQEIHDATTKADKEPESDRFKWLERPFLTITYAEAAEIIEKHHGRFDKANGLAKAHELFLVKHLQSPVFVVNWPKHLKPFYMRTCKDDDNLVEAVDFLMPMVGELAGGSVREDDFDKLKANTPDDLKWYLDLRKYGGCTTGGFGIGFDRYLQELLNVSNIKDTIAFPRWPHHCQT